MSVFHERTIAFLAEYSCIVMKKISFSTSVLGSVVAWLTRDDSFISFHNPVKLKQKEFI